MPMKECLRALSCISLSLLAAYAQTPPNGPSFEVATVKLATSEPARDVPIPDRSVEMMMRFSGGPGTKSPERIDYSGVTLKMLLERAYGVWPSQIVGPRWLDTQRYVVAAKLPKETTPKLLQLMLQQLLTERFQINLHHGSRTLPVYDLVWRRVVRSWGPPEKLPEYKDEAEERAAQEMKAYALMMAEHNAHERDPHIGAHLSFTLSSATAQEFAEKLSSYVDRPVRDRTQLPGVYAFALNWVPEGAHLPGDPPSGPSIFVALQEQLGLKLQPRDDRFDVLVIDKADQSPTNN
jgi:uncharacterized protein (TIGR03435 family)